MFSNNGTTVAFSVVDNQTMLKGTVKVKDTDPFTGDVDVNATISCEGVRLGGGGDMTYVEDTTEIEVPIECGVFGVGEPSAEIKVNDLTLKVDKDGNVT